MAAVIHQINISPGGVPKLPVATATVGPNGIAGDGHVEPPPAHGGPDKALCLLALEVIEQWAAEGHPVFAGATGENITVQGLDWSLVVPGVRMRLGAEVQIEVTGYAVPCKKNARWFSDGNFARLSHKLSPNRARVYAQVRHGGTLAPGDPVTIESPG